MTTPEPMALCVPPGGQIVLFSLPVDDAAPSYSVTDRDGRTRAHTNSLGVALAVTRRVLDEHGEVWVRASDDTTAHLHGQGISSDTPDRPWISSIAATLEG